MKKNKRMEILNQRAASPTEVLKADPFLPTRIKALAEQKTVHSFPRASKLVLWSYILIGFTFGAYMGANLFNTTVPIEDNSALISGYTNILYQEDFSDSWLAVMEQEEHDDEK